MLELRQSREVSALVIVKPETVIAWQREHQRVVGTATMRGRLFRSRIRVRYFARRKQSLRGALIGTNTIDNSGKHTSWSIRTSRAARAESVRFIQARDGHRGLHVAGACGEALTGLQLSARLRRRMSGKEKRQYSY